MSNGLLAAALDWVGWGRRRVDYRSRYRDALNSESGLEDTTDNVIPLYRDANENINCPIVRAEPTTMDEATVVADEIKRHIPVMLNLEETPPDEARRIRDFLGGVTYGLNGYMRKVGSWVYICSPFDMPIEKLVLDPSRSGQDRYEDDDLD